MQNELDLRHAIYKYFSEKYFIFEKNGKGKEYDYEGGLIFEGEYLKGEKNGRGKEYYDNNIIFEGEYLNGERFGRGKEYYDNNIIFEGGKGNRKGKKI